MTAQSASAGAHTYVLDQEQFENVVDLVAALQAKGVDVPVARPALVAADGGRLNLPEPVFEALLQVVTAMSRGQGVTVVPQDTLLTTQEAAESLGISRPTLVRLLGDGHIPFETRGRHRRVALLDLLDYQRRMRSERRRRLADMSAEAQASGIYAATAGPPRRTR